MLSMLNFDWLICLRRLNLIGQQLGAWFLLTRIRQLQIGDSNAVKKKYFKKVFEQVALRNSSSIMANEVS